MVESFIFRLFDARKEKKVSKQDMLSRIEPFALAPDVHTFFQALPDRTYSEEELVDGLNDVIRRQGRMEEFGGPIAKIEHTPEAREEAMEPLYTPKDHS